jgi:MazG family protein
MCPNETPSPALVTPALEDIAPLPLVSGPPAPLQRFADIIATLRGPQGCPWDLKQTHASLRPYLLEESYELIDAIDADSDEAIAEELGDVLLQVVLHAQIAHDRGAFDLARVIALVSDKMVRRHPHVFAGGTAEDADAVLKAWKELKRAEGRGLLDGVPRSAPAVQRAQQIATRAGSVGFDWPSAQEVIAKIKEETAEVEEAMASGSQDAMEDELGDLMFAVVNLGRKLGLDAEAALRRTNAKFERRFGGVLSKLAGRGLLPEQSDLAEMDALWEEVKREERGLR